MWTDIKEMPDIISVVCHKIIVIWAPTESCQVQGRSLREDVINQCLEFATEHVWYETKRRAPTHPRAPTMPHEPEQMLVKEWQNVPQAVLARFVSRLVLTSMAATCDADFVHFLSWSVIEWMPWSGQDNVCFCVLLLNSVKEWWNFLWNKKLTCFSLSGYLCCVVNKNRTEHFKWSFKGQVFLAASPHQPSV